MGVRPPVETLSGGVTYYVYENPHRGRSRVHRGDCCFCNQGIGARWADTSTHWHGPFAERAVAFEYGNQAIGEVVRACGTCRP